MNESDKGTFHHFALKNNYLVSEIEDLKTTEKIL